jgi:hypothetical protein
MRNSSSLSQLPRDSLLAFQVTIQAMQPEGASEDVLFAVNTPLNFRVRTTARYWQLIVTIKHPVMMGHDREVTEALENPAEIRRSRSDPTVYLFYREAGSDRWICAVAKRLNGEGFLITTYLTDAIKEGDRIWPR